MTDEPKDNILRPAFGVTKPEPEDPDTIYPGDKRLEIFSDLIDRGKVSVLFSTTKPGVVIPTSLQNRQIARLDFSHRFYLDDFAYDKQGVRASLSFGGVPTWCDIPWEAVALIGLGEPGEEGAIMRKFLVEVGR